MSSRVFALEAGVSREGPRLGLVVSRRVGGAVVRNRIKRIVREWFRRHRAQLAARGDVVVIARSEAAHRATRELWQDLGTLVARVAR